jgi:hypothetical protein
VDLVCPGEQSFLGLAKRRRLYRGPRVPQVFVHEISSSSASENALTDSSVNALLLAN